MIEMSKFIVNKHEDTVNKKKRALFVIAVILLLTPCAADAQTMWEHVSEGSSIVSGDVYLFTNYISNYGGEYTYAMCAKDTGAVYQAGSIPFTYDSSTGNGYVDSVNSETCPYEITIEKHKKGYSLKTEVGYLCYESNSKFENSSELTEASYWTFNYDNKHPKFISVSNDEYIIGADEHTEGWVFAPYDKDGYHPIGLFHKLDGIDVTISEVGYATLYYSAKNLLVPDDVTAFTVKYVYDTLKISRIYKSRSIIPKNTAVILSGEEGTYTFFETDSTGKASNYNALLGTDEETALEADDNCYFYILSLNKDNDISSVGFYWANSDGSAFTNGAHKAYLKLPKSSSETSGSPKSSFLFSELADSDEAYEEEDYDAEGDISADSETSFGGGATGIAAVEGGASGEPGEVCYTIQGVKIDKPTAKGLYIINGKKYVIK